LREDQSLHNLYAIFIRILHFIPILESEQILHHIGSCFGFASASVLITLPLVDGYRLWEIDIYF